MSGLILRFRRNESGAAAVEMALLAPFLIAIVVSVITIAPLIWTKQSMHVAVNAGAQYVMAGATDATAIQQVTMSGWSRRPNDGVVNVSQYCVCNGVTASCTTLCNGAAPPRYTLISASTTYQGVTGNTALSAQQRVRTR